MDVLERGSQLNPPANGVKFAQYATRSPSQASINIPGFDKKGYGHPSVQASRRPSSHNRPNAQEQRDSPETLPAPANETVAQIASHEIETKTSPSATAGHQQSSFCQEAPQEPTHQTTISGAAEDTPSSHVDMDVKGQNVPATPSFAPPTPCLDRDEVAAPEKRPSPPATYHTLKKEGETPEQVIARLQAAGTREAHLRMRRTAKGEVVTTGLSTLDFLRASHVPDSDSVLPSQPEPVSFQPIPDFEKDSNSGLHQYLGDVGPADQEAAVKSQKKTSVPRAAHTFAQSSSNGVDGPIIADPGHAVRSVAPVATGTTTARIALRDSSEEPLDSTQATTTATTRPSPPKFQPRQPPVNRNRSRWVTNAETKPQPYKPDSNAEGSELPESDDDSTKPMEWGYGRLIRSRGPAVGESQLVGWDGQLQPPPVDWENRAGFQNKNPEYISGFDGWLGETTVRTMQSVARSTQVPQEQTAAADIEFGVIPPEKVQDVNNHADGIGFVPRETILNPQNAERYGHRLGETIVDAAKAPPPDFEAEAKLDLKDPDNRRYRDETAQMFIDKRLMHVERQRKEAHDQRKAAEASTMETPVVTQPAKAKPIKTNIYLRPAVKADYAGMTRIYNWHIMNGVRPCELTEVNEEELEARHNISTNARLPFIVAVERTRKNSRQKAPSRRVNPNHPVQNIDPEYSGMVKDENVVGWASATDWSACDYVETTTAELEVYVAPDFRQKGVGRCLMDALLDATDRGYISKGGYDFHVAPEIKHLYSGGGGRDLHKIIFQIRSFNRPITPEQRYRAQRFAEEGRNWGYADGNNSKKGWASRKSLAPEEKKDFSKTAKIDDREDDYSVWMKEWLESFGFEEEGLIKKIGTKDKRFVDVRYVSKETAWQPAEHRLPDFSNGI